MIIQWHFSFYLFYIISRGWLQPHIFLQSGSSNVFPLLAGYVYQKLKYNRWNIRIQMKYNQELYQQYLQSRTKFNSQTYSQHYKRRAILQQLVQLPDDHPINLESSINILFNLGVVNSFKNIEELSQLSETKKKTGGWNEGEVELWECKLISFIWAVLEDQTIDMREFKELLMVLLSEQGNRHSQIAGNFGDKQDIEVLIQAWDHLFNSNTDSQECSEEINDISIIKSKNEHPLKQNKQNYYSNENREYQTARNSLHSNRYDHGNKKMQKSYQRKTAVTTVERNGSLGRISSKRSQHASFNNYVPDGRQISNFIQQNQNLTVEDQKRLVDRLYKVDVYREREEKKRLLEEERALLQMKQCTFRPAVANTSTSRLTGHNSSVQDKNIKGFEKAINRMKLGYQKNRELKQVTELRKWRVNKQFTGKPTHPTAPKFTEKQVRQTEQYIFIATFTFGKTVVPIKVRSSDIIEDLVAKAGRIFTLKQKEKKEIQEGLLKYLQQYFSECVEYPQH